MRKVLISLVALTLLVGCGPQPGDEGGRCLEGDTCTWDDLICGPDGTCQRCGSIDQLCCQGDMCQEGYACGSDGICHQCGWDGKPCCEGSTCSEGYVCGSDELCHSCGLADSPCCEGSTCKEGYICGSDALCHPCGRLDTPCCEDNTCLEWHYCSTDGQCQSCGGLRKTCCPDESCRGWLGCLDGQCANPFEIDPSTDLSICMEAEEGNSDRSQRDWCYWYAAYLRGDAAICESIEWSKMRRECAKGGDPDDYYVFPASSQ